MSIVPRNWGFGPLWCLSGRTLGEEGCAIAAPDAAVHVETNGMAVVELAMLIRAISAECLHAEIGAGERAGKELPL